MHCKKCYKIFLINFRWHLSCFQNLIAESQNSLILQQILSVRVSTNFHMYCVIVSKCCQFNSITPTRNKKVLNVLDTIWQHLQCEGADMDTFFCLKKQLQTTTAQYFMIKTMLCTIKQYFVFCNALFVCIY